MIKLFKSILGLEKTKGPVVSGRKDGSDVECYIPYSKDSGDNPVIATEQFAMPKGGCDISAPLLINKITGANKLQLSMANTGSDCNFAPLDLSADSQYLQIGGREFNTNSYRGIGFGHTWETTQVSPVFVGMQEINSTGTTNGDFIVATRDTLDTASPIVRFRVDSSGQILGTSDYIPKLDYSLATKKYVDDAVKGGGSSSSVIAKNVSCPAMSPSGTAVNVEDILRELNARIYNIEKQMPH